MNDRTAAAPGVVIEGVEYAYPPPRRIQALQGIDLRFNAGDFIALVGQNGSGKTSLARCISGYLEPTRGQITVAGQHVHRLAPSSRALLVGYVFQNPDHQLFKESVWQEVAFGLRNLKLPAERVERDVQAVLNSLELGNKQDWHPFRLSKGDRQRLAIAAILVMRPGVLIVDEPTTGQDPAKSREIMDLLATLNREQGTTIVIITHAMELVAEYARRMVVLHAGRVLAEGSPREVFKQRDLLQVSNISPPPVCQLAIALGLEPLPLTVPEASRAILVRMSP